MYIYILYYICRYIYILISLGNSHYLIRGKSGRKLMLHSVQLWYLISVRGQLLFL